MRSVTMADFESVHSLLEALRLPNNDVRLPAERQIEELQSCPGFCTLLDAISVSAAVSLESRWMAVICLKNVVHRHWRKSQRGTLSQEERSHIKCRLLSRMDEPSDLIAVQIAAVISKIARVDWPNQWQELFPSLFQTVHVGSELQIQRGLLCLHFVLKELASKCMLADKTRFRKNAKEIFGAVCQLRSLYVDALLTYVKSTDIRDPNDPQLLRLGARLLLAEKVLARLAVHGLSRLDENPEAHSVLVSSLPSMYPFISIGNALPKDSKAANVFDRLTRYPIRTAIGCLTANPIHFRLTLQPFLEFCYQQVMTVTFDEERYSGNVGSERHIMLCMQFLTQVLSESIFDPNAVQEAVSPEQRQCLDLIAWFFSAERVQTLSQFIVNRYLPLRRPELSEWESDPESYLLAYDSLAADNDLRTCSETLQLVLSQRFKDLVVSVLHEFIAESITGPVQNLNELLHRESICYAVGIGAFDLTGSLDFHGWFIAALHRDITDNSSPLHKVLHRRVAWLMGQYVSGIDASQKHVCYSTLVFLLQHKDLVVKITAAQTINLFLCDPEFDLNSFLEFAPAVLSLLIGCIPLVSEFDIQQQLLAIVAVIIGHMDDKIAPFGTAILEGLSKVWVHAQHSAVLQSAVVDTLLRLVQALGLLCAAFQPFLIDVITVVTDVKREHDETVIEDGVKLWATTLRNLPEASDAMLELFPRMLALLDRDLQYLKPCISIIESYTLLGGPRFMSICGSHVVSLVNHLLSHAKTRGVSWVLGTVELLLQLYPQDAMAVLESSLCTMLNLLADPEFEVVKPRILAVFARLIFQSGPWTINFLLQCGASSNSNFFLSLVDLLLEQWDYVTHPLRKKTVALALISLLSTVDQDILNRFSAILNICVDILHTLEGEFRDDRFMPTLADSDVDEDSEQVAPETAKRNQLAKRDVVLTTNLREYLCSKLAECSIINGPAVFQRLLATVDPLILDQLKTVNVTFS
eukprot:GILK01009953.1.p1 GENE.GILK01009953.1~~GILK01009953.1.p1  ORF type:complete len:978 (+),score=171.98 GILK01009953.1:1723-4656(+)